MKKQILEAIQKGIKIGLLESGFNFSLDDLDHIEDYGLKKKKLDRQFFKDEFDRQQKEYEKTIFPLIIQKMINKTQNFSSEDKEQFLKLSNFCTYIPSDYYELENIVDTVFYIFGNISLNWLSYKINNNDELFAVVTYVLKKFGPTTNLNWINTSNATSLNGLFSYSIFNGDISEWDVSNVKNMSETFASSTFNGDLSKWNVSNVTNMERMFFRSEFNNNSISNWDVSSVLIMYCMFANSKFEGSLSEWDVSKVQNMDSMFSESKFNGDIAGWDISSAISTAQMFYKSQFNHNISDWDMSNVKDMSYMFWGCPIKEKYKPKNYE